jgi:hypothetical protein
MISFSFSSTQMHDVFVNRWYAFHAPIATAAYVMDREFCRREVSSLMKKELYAVMRDFSKAPGSPSFFDMKSQYAEFESAVGCKRVSVCVCVCVRVRVSVCVVGAFLGSVCVPK